MTTALAPIDAIRAEMTRMNGEFHKALPQQIPVERFIRTAITAVQMEPSLMQADRRSLFAACMKAAQDGLLVDGREAALVKYGERVQYMPMVNGILKKLRQSGQLLSINAHVVYENDTFEFELGDNERIVHKPALLNRGRPIAVYAIAYTTEGGAYREVMSVADIESIRNLSRSGNSSPWKNHWPEMAKKTVVRRICKRLPSSTDIDSVLLADNEHYDLSRQAAQPEAPAQPRTSRLKAAIARRATPAAPALEAITVDAEPSKEVNDGTADAPDAE